MDQFYVEIIRNRDRKVMHRVGPMGKRQTVPVAASVQSHMRHRCFVRVVPENTDEAVKEQGGERAVKHDASHPMKTGVRGWWCVKCERWLCRECCGYSVRDGRWCVCEGTGFKDTDEQVREGGS